MNKDVVLLTEGGRDIGLGHVTRCLSLAQAFQARGYSCRLMVNGDQSVRGALDDIPFALGDWTRKENYSTWEGAGIVFIDSYLAPPDFYKTVSRRVPIALYLDDTKRLHYPPGIVINWSIAAEEMDYPKKEGITYLLGPQYISLRSPFWQMEINPPESEISSLMVTFGGDDSKNMTPVVLHWLTQTYPHIKKNIIIGNAFQNLQQIQEASDGNTTLIHSPNAEGMKEMMQRADIAVSSGGQTLYELARAGVPTMAVSVAENQLNNVAAWERTGFIENAGLWTDPELMDRMKTKFEILTGYKRRQQAATAGIEAVPGNGADRIIDHIETDK